MSGLEVIGAVASVSQLIQYSANLILIIRGACQNAEKFAARYHHHEQQVAQLLEIAELIRATAGLRSQLVLIHVESLIGTVKTIEEALQRLPSPTNSANKWERVRKALEIPKTEDTVFKRFEDLERDKSGLTICILMTIGGHIVQVQNCVEAGIPTLKEQVGSIQETLRDCPEFRKQCLKIRKESPDAADPCSSCQETEIKDPETKELVILGVPAVQEEPSSLPQHSYAEPGPCNADLALDVEDDNENTPDNYAIEGSDDDGSETYCHTDADHVSLVNGRAWTYMLASDDSRQLNGDLGEIPAGFRQARCSWKNITAQGRSNQVNGNIHDADSAIAFFDRG